MLNKTEYKNTWLGITHIEYWLNTPGDTGVTGELVSNYLSQMWTRLIEGNSSSYAAIFDGFVVETWHHQVAEATDDMKDWDIEHAAGLTNTLNSKINSKYCSAGTYSHEFGHNYSYVMGLYWDGGKGFSTPNTEVAKSILTEYRRIRGRDCTPRTNECERWAEDFKFFFGANNVANVRDPNDDAYQGIGVRWADQVPGLKKFIQAALPVYNHLKFRSFRNFNYFDQDNLDYYRWENLSSNRWECYWGGAFYYWGPSGWVRM